MPRPKLKSDDEVLDAARLVLKRRGPVDFTLNDVAKEVGLARATLIQRFKNRDELLVRMMERETAHLRVHLAAMPAMVGPEGVWTFLQALVRGMGSGYEFSVNLLISWYEAQVPELRELAALRTRLVQAAIRERLPPELPESAAVLLHTVLGGAALQWVAEQKGTLADYVLRRLAEALQLLFAGHGRFDVASTSPVSGSRNGARGDDTD